MITGEQSGEQSNRQIHETYRRKKNLFQFFFFPFLNNFNSQFNISPYISFAFSFYFVYPYIETDYRFPHRLFSHFLDTLLFHFNIYSYNSRTLVMKHQTFLCLIPIDLSEKKIKAKSKVDIN